MKKWKILKIFNFSNFQISDCNFFKFLIFWIFCIFKSNFQFFQVYNFKTEFWILSRPSPDSDLVLIWSRQNPDLSLDQKNSRLWTKSGLVPMVDNSAYNSFGQRCPLSVLVQNSSRVWNFSCPDWYLDFVWTRSKPDSSLDLVWTTFRFQF